MEQDRYEEYITSKEDANSYPEALNQVELRLMKRLHKRRQKLLLRGSGILSSVFILFTLLVNTQTAIADAIFDIPLIGALAEYVSFDKGIQNALLNEYVQEVNLVQESNGYTLGLPYVIADSKRLVLFFQLPKDLMNQEDALYQVLIDNVISPTTGMQSIEYMHYKNVNNKDLPPDQDGLFIISVRTGDELPRDIKLEVSLRDPIPEYLTETTDDFEPLPDDYLRILGTYEFELHLKEYPKPKVLTRNQVLQVMGQTLNINTITEYPTGIEINASMPDGNTSVINGLDFKAYDSKGNIWNKVGSITSNPPNSNHTIICYLENDYFAPEPLERVEITGIRIFDKSEENITVDLLNKTLSPKPSELSIKEIEKSGDKANITFEVLFNDTQTTDHLSYFDFEYKDLQGNEYSNNSISSYTHENSTQIYFSTVWPEDNKVVMTRLRSPMIELEKPVEIELNMQLD